MVLRFKWESRSPPFLKILPRKFLPRKGDRLAGEDFFYGFPRPPFFPVLILCNKVGRGEFSLFYSIPFLLVLFESVLYLCICPGFSVGAISSQWVLKRGTPWMAREWA